MTKHKTSSRRELNDSDGGLDAHLTVLAADLRPDGRFGIVSFNGYDPAPISAFFD